ncbi:hypothetical protein ACFSR2_20710, partial [Emticicia soli]
VNTAKICLGETATLTATGCNGTVTWTGGGTPSGSTLAVKPTAAGTTSYTATCTTSKGCIGTADGKVETAPKPSIAVNDLTICAGESGKLEATGCTGVVTWSTGATGTSITVSAEGTYTATCTLTTNGKVCTAEASGVVKANSKPQIAVADVEVCAGKEATLVATGCSNGTITWNTGATGSTLKVTQANAGTYNYTATCTISSNNATCVNSATGKLTVNPNPVITINTAKICLGETATLTATGCTGTISWTGGGTPSGSTLAVKPTVSGTTTYTATCTTSKGCIGTADGKVETAPKPSIAVNDLTICAGESGKLEATGCTGVVTWSTGATGTSITVSAEGTYTATCTLTTNG